MIRQSTSDLLRYAMFDRGVQSAKEIGLVNEDVYICPICGNCYDAQALDARTLLLEHVPPRALGGKPLTLTCKDCNTRKLSYADSQLVQRERGIRFFERIYQKKSTTEQWFKFRLADTEVNALISTTEGRLDIHVPMAHNKPEHVDAYKDELRRKSNRSVNFSFTSKHRYNPWFSNLADLKIAFLYCFAFFGYSYALHEMHDPVRRQLYSPNSRDLTHFWFAKKKEEKDLLGITLSIIQPVHLIVFLRRTKIALPWFTKATALYEHLRDSLKSGSSVPYKIERMFELPTRMIMLLDRR